MIMMPSILEADMIDIRRCEYYGTTRLEVYTVVPAAAKTMGQRYTTVIQPEAYI